MHHGVEVHVIIASVHHPACHELGLWLVLLLLKIHSHHVLLVVHSHHRGLHGSSHHVALILGISRGIHIPVHVHILHHHRITSSLLRKILHIVRPLHAHHVLVHHEILLRHPGVSIRIDIDWHGRVGRSH